MNIQILRNIKTGTYHRGCGNSTICNHSGAHRIPRCVPAHAKDLIVAADALFCRRCFPAGKPHVESITSLPS